MSTAKICRMLTLGFALLAPSAAQPQVTRSRSPFDDILDRAVAATEAKDFATALELYRQLEQSESRWHAWAGTSGQVAIHRMAGEGDSARAITARIAIDRPELGGLMAIWDGDTTMLEGDPEGAAAAYQLALDLHGNEWVDGKPIGATALEQISRVRLELGDARGAAEAERQLLQKYPRFVDPKLAMAKVLAYEAMESGELPLKPLEKLVHDGDCSSSRPCVFAGGRVTRQMFRGAAPLIGSGGVYIVPDAGFTETLRTASTSAQVAPTVTSTAAACTLTEASDGFQNPITNVAYGYRFMTNPDCCGGWHPGADLNGAGDDCNLDFVAAARGCVRDVMSSSTDWGTAAVEHSYSPGLWTSQYGHGDRVYYSADQAIAKGAALGNVDKIGRATGCHLHFEIREADHTARNDASSYHNSPQATVGDEYQDPEPFIAAHRAYQEVRWVDEESFSFTGTWQLINGVGDQDDLKYALTTSTLSNYARYEWTPSTSGNHEVWAFVPWDHATSTRVPIKVANKSTGATVMSTSVNQSAYYDAWVRVGAAVLSAGTTYYIEVASNTGESSLKVAVDDFLIIRTDNQGGNCIATVPADRWKGEYFNNRDLSGNPSLVRDDGNGFLNFDWTTGSPSSSCGIGVDNFSARFTRSVYFNAGTYRFTVTSDDGVRLYVDGVLKLDKWFDQGATTYTVDVALAAGNHALRMDYYENGGYAVAKLSWNLVSSPCIASVPADRWKGEYFNNRDLTGNPSLVRDDGNGFLNFDWTTGSPSSSCGIGVDNFSARFTRSVYFNAGTYRFTVTSDDGVRLYVDGVLKLDKWFDQGATTYTVDVALAAGNHTLRMDYYENGGYAVAKLSWNLVSSPCSASVPADRWKGEYFNNRDLTGNPSLVRDDGNGFLNFDWTTGSPSSSCGIGVDNFSARFTRSVYFNAGTYRFTVTSDDGVRLYVDGVLKLDKWFDQGATTYTVDVALAAGNHALRMDYYENGGYAVAKLSWNLASAPASIIVDDLDSGFARFGPSQYWWQASLGYRSHMWWTYVNGTVKGNYARWTPNLGSAGAGNYRVSVFIPRDNATSQQARYLIYHNGQSTYSAPVNQSLYFDQWVSIGTYYFSAAGGEFVELADATGESSTSYRKLGFDAVLFEK